MQGLDCELIRGFINDHSDISFLYMLKQEKDDCMEMYEFIEEMQLMGKFFMYSHIKANLDQ